MTINLNKNSSENKISTPVISSVRPLDTSNRKKRVMVTLFLIKTLMMLALFTFVAPEIVLGQPDTLWTRTYGGSDDDWGYHVQQTSDGGYIIAGLTDSYGKGNFDVWLMKTDSSGVSVWTKTYEGERGNSLQQTSDGGYIIVGHILIEEETIDGILRGYDVLLIKTNESGNTLWTKAYHLEEDDLGRSVQQVTDGGYIIVANTDYTGLSFTSMSLLKTDEWGERFWTKSYGIEWGNSVQQTSDGGYIIVGYNDWWDQSVRLLKTDVSGDTLWTRTFGGSGFEHGTSVQQTSDGGYIIAGLTDSYGAGNVDVWLIKTDASGDTLWTKTYGGSDYDAGSSVQQTSDDGYIITGSTNSYGAGSSDVWLIRVAPATGTIAIEEKNSTIPSSFLLHQNYPNPFNPVTTITYQLPKSEFVNLSIYNVAGQLVETIVSERISAGYHFAQWNASDVSSGVYFYRIEAGEYAETKKCLILK